MAYKKNKKKSNSYRGKKTYSAAEKKSYKRGFFAGLFSAKKKKSSSKYNKSKSKKHTRTLMEDIKYYRAHNLGVLYRDGKYYDTNFIDKPHELEKSFVKHPVQFGSECNIFLFVYNALVKQCHPDTGVNHTTIFIYQFQLQRTWQFGNNYIRRNII